MRFTIARKAGATLKRREFVKGFGLGVASFGLFGAAPAFAETQPQVAITIDDFNWFDVPRMSAEARNQSLLGALRARSLKAAVFVAGKFVDNEKGAALLADWDREGHLIGNHTYSHPYYPSVSFEKFSADVLRCEEVIGKLPRFRKLFRFPYLKEGETPRKRDAMRAFLKTHGYRNGHVTIDASDWYVDQRLRARLEKEPGADPTPYGKYYLEHIWERSRYYDELSRRVVGRSVSHTLLLHHNVLNGLFLGDLLKMYAEKGWKLIDAETAFRDPVFASAPNVTPAGESLVWSLAKANGRYEKLLRYPAEDGEYEKARMDALGL
jgi:peptidoglycan/xylan/chitin deacetylase (PgdA/CDA1 family)